MLSFVLWTVVDLFGFCFFFMVFQAIANTSSASTSTTRLTPSRLKKLTKLHDGLGMWSAVCTRSKDHIAFATRLHENNFATRLKTSLNCVCLNIRWNLDYLMERIWQELALVRVYTKPKGGAPDFEEPLVLSNLRHGITVEVSQH